MKKIFDKKHISRTTTYLMVVLAYIIITILQKTGNLGSLFTSLLVPVCCFMVAGIGLNLNVGISGELNLGQAGFMSVGAFSGIVVSGLLAPSISSPIIRLIVSIIVGAIVASLFGYLIGIPVLKLQGDYLAIVTLAFGQIIMSLINNLYIGVDNNGIQMSFVDNKLNLGDGGRVLISGPMGANGVDRISNFTMGIALVIISLIIVYNLMYSKQGRAIMAARDNRIAAESIGINISKTKMLAFVVSAALAGAAGALYGLNFSTVIPTKFDFNTSILILVYVVLGGLGNMKGTIISTTLLVLLPELLRSLQTYRMIIYAVVLIIIMLVSNNDQLKSMFTKVFKKNKKGGVENV